MPPLPRLLSACAALVAVLAGSTARSESAIERVGVGASLALPALGPSLFLDFGDRFSAVVATGAIHGRAPVVQAQLNYRREASRGGYWLVGAGIDELYYLARAGYGFAWQRGSFRLHLEASLNLPQPVSGEAEGFEGLDYIFPIGLGIHYLFGKS